MSQPSLVIISEDSDFSSVLASHAAEELGLEVEVVAAPEKAKTLKSQLIIAQAPMTGNFPAPILLVEQKPARLQDVLEKIAAQLAKEELPIAGALFSVQQKMLTHGKKTASLTDKESQLLLLLIKNKNGVAKEILLKDVWGVTSELESHTLETHVYRLRAKLKDAGVAATIAAAPGKYVLEV
jgi:hypothetical protein